MLESQQAAYKVPGVNESEPAIDLRKRKAGGEGEGVSCVSTFLLTYLMTVGAGDGKWPGKEAESRAAAFREEEQRCLRHIASGGRGHGRATSSLLPVRSDRRERREQQAKDKTL